MMDWRCKWEGYSPLIIASMALRKRNDERPRDTVTCVTI
jgi:hypothetical protein